jgi:hypothetical protein
MPMTLNVGVSRKVGLPDFCSIGASCNLQVELDSGLLQHDLDGFHAQVRDAFVAAQQAVNDELVRLQGPAGTSRTATTPTRDGNEDPPRPDGTGPSTDSGGASARPGAPGSRVGSPRERPGKPCTPNQARAIRAIARNAGCDLKAVLREQCGVESPDALTLAQASALIDTLKAASGA